MNTITQDLEIWLICSTPWPTKNISKSFHSNALHNIYSQSNISPYISYGEALEVHALLQPFPELVLESNHLMPSLSLLIIWLAKKSFVLRKIHL